MELPVFTEGVRTAQPTAVGDTGTPFLFWRKSASRRDALMSLAGIRTAVFFVSPHPITKTPQNTPNYLIAARRIA